MRALSFLLLALFTFSTGCTDTLTYANKSREEGVRLYNERAYADAAGAFRNAIRQDPRDYRSHYFLGVCYDGLRQHHQAFSEYRISLEVISKMGAVFTEPEFRQQVMNAYGTSLARAENEAELNALEKRAQSSTRGEEWFILAKAFRARGDADRAVDCYTRAARADSKDFFIRKEFALYLLDPLSQNQEAEYWLRQANRLAPSDVEVNAGLQRLGVNTRSARIKEAPSRLTPPQRTTAISPAVQPVIAPPPQAIRGSAADLPRD